MGFSGWGLRQIVYKCLEAVTPSPTSRSPSFFHSNSDSSSLRILPYFRASLWVPPSQPKEVYQDIFLNKGSNYFHSTSLSFVFSFAVYSLSIAGFWKSWAAMYFFNLTLLKVINTSFSEYQSYTLSTWPAMYFFNLTLLKVISTSFSEY